MQTFPDYYEFMGGNENLRRHIGMAVPPDGAKIIIEGIIKSFVGIEYETEPSKWEEELDGMLSKGKSNKNKKGSATKKKNKNLNSNTAYKEGQCQISI